MRLLPLFVILGACAGTPPSPQASPVSEPQDVEHEPPPPPAFALDLGAPLAACHHVQIDQTQSWSCGPHRVVLVGYADGLPPEPAAGFRGDAPETSTLTVSTPDGDLQAQVLTQPDDGMGRGLISVVLRDTAGRRIVSCALDGGAASAERLLAWCSAALTQALQP